VNYQHQHSLERGGRKEKRNVNFFFGMSMQNCEEEITSATGIRLEEYLQNQSILAETLEIG
jgi:hypothetical protein